VAGVAADQQAGEFVDHLPQHLGAPVVEREDEALSGAAVLVVHEHQDAAD
jgi:hypothetical protein